MSKASVFIGHTLDANACATLREEAESLIIPNAEYPEYIFSRAFKYHYFLETAVAQNPAFLATFGVAAGEDQISLVSVRPDAESFWLESSGHRGVIRMSVHEILRHWEDAMNSSNSITTLYNVPNPQVIFGNTKSWIIHCDLAWDLAVLGVPTDIRRLMIAGMQFVHDVSWAEQYWRPWARMDNAFYDRLKRNYPHPNYDKDTLIAAG